MKTLIRLTILYDITEPDDILPGTLACHWFFHQFKCIEAHSEFPIDHIL